MSPCLLALAPLLLAPQVPDMLYRADWGAEPPVLQLPRHEIRYITVHHTGMPQDPNRSLTDKLQGLQAWSQRDDFLAGGRAKPKWADIPYHYYIDWQGQIAECRPIYMPGDTNTSYDPTGHALIVVEGSFPTDEFSDAQRGALYRLTWWLAKEHDVPGERVNGHRHYAPGETTCPGRSVVEELPMLRRSVDMILRRSPRIVTQTP